MIRKYKPDDLTTILHIWLETNISAHDFIPKEYWINHYEMVRDVLPLAEIYVYEDDATNLIQGFIGLNDHYVAGLFVDKAAQSKGIGSQLLRYAQVLKKYLHLSVYQKNLKAIRFYQREQFWIQSVSIDKSTNEAELIMAWALRPAI